MATNSSGSSVFGAIFFTFGLFLFIGSTEGGASHVNYYISSADGTPLTSEARLSISFGKADVLSRYRRQTVGDNAAPVIDGGAINPDATGNQTNSTGVLPDDTNVPSGGSVTSDGMTTADPPAQTTATTTTPPAPTGPTKDPFFEADKIFDRHKYYESSIFKDRLNDYWVELQSTPKHETLSHSHRVAVNIPLKFQFFFYGHPVSNVTVATGGFIYMSPFLHKWLTATQYIAPLMANFDPSLAEGSSIYYKSYDTKFIVEWRDVKLKDQNNTGAFTFQAILNKDSSIFFVYKKIPITVSRISTEQHPVKIGLSDAYYNDTLLPEFKLKKRTIYEYHKVEVPTSTIKEGTVVLLNSLPTCNRLETCEECNEHLDVNFDCQWCGRLGRCSDGFDWYRQHWDKQGCKQSKRGCPKERTVTLVTNHGTGVSSSSRLSNDCPDCVTKGGQRIPMTKKLNDDRFSTVGVTGRVTVRMAAVFTPPHLASDCLDGKCNKSKFPTAAVIVATLALVGLIGAVIGWVYYAYTHPTSTSGMWLMEHRPSQIKAKIQFWKNSSGDSSAKYKAETEA